MTINSLILVLSNVLVFAAYIFYVIGIVQGKAKPHRTTRFVLLIITSLATASLFAQHNSIAIWLASISAFMSLIIFILTIRYGMGGWSKIDILCFVVALVGIVSWKITDNASIALFSAIVADFTGCIPTLIKIYRYPKTEVWTFFALGGISSALNLAATKTWTLESVAYPLYLTFIGMFFAILVIRGNAFAKNQKIL